MNENLRRQFQAALQRGDLQHFPALLGNGTGSVAVSGRPGYVYVRIGREQSLGQAFNQRVPTRENLPVIVGYSPERPDLFQVLSLREVYVGAGYDKIPQVVAHHESHEFGNEDGGEDTTWIQKQQTVPMLCYPTSPISMYVSVMPDWYPWNTAWNYFEGATSADLSGHIPSLPGEARFVLISIDGATNVLQYSSGSTFVIGMPLADIDVRVPAPPLGSVPVCAVYITGATTTLDWENLYDLRLFNSPVGGSISPGTHELLDAVVHSDTVTHTPPVQGDLIVGNATPAWDDLPIGIAHQLLKVNAGATDPAWSSFDWDEIAAAVAADMVHDHSAAGEGGEVPLASLGGYTQGDLIYGGTADWQDLVHPGAANRVLQSSAVEVAWSANAVTFPAAGAVPVGAGAANRVTYWSDANTITSDAGLTYDAATGSLDIAGHMAVGATAVVAATAVVSVYEAPTFVAGDFFGEDLLVEFSPGANFATNVYGLRFGTTLQTAYSRTGGRLFGLYGWSRIGDGIDARDVYLTGGQFVTDVEDAGVGGGVGVVEATGLNIWTPFVDTGSCTSGYGIRIRQGVVGAGSMTTLYGLYIDALAAGGTTYAIYSLGGDSYHAGDFTFGGDLLMADDHFVGITGDIRIEFDSSDGDIMFHLGDAAGADEVQVLDSGGAVKVAIDSDGEILAQRFTLDAAMAALPTRGLSLYSSTRFMHLANTAAATGILYVSASEYIQMCGNAYYTGAVWNRVDTTKSSWGIWTMAGVLDYFTIYHATAAANPIAAWSTYLRINSAGRLGLGGATNLLAQLHVNQSSATATTPVLRLYQADVSEPFTDYRGTFAASAANSLSSWTTGNAVQGHIQIDVNGVKRWLRFYDDPTS